MPKNSAKQLTLRVDQAQPPKPVFRPQLQDMIGLREKVKKNDSFGITPAIEKVFGSEDGLAKMAEGAFFGDQQDAYFLHKTILGTGCSVRIEIHFEANQPPAKVIVLKPDPIKPFLATGQTAGNAWLQAILDVMIHRETQSRNQG